MLHLVLSSFCAFRFPTQHETNSCCSIFSLHGVLPHSVSGNGEAGHNQWTHALNPLLLHYSFVRCFDMKIGTVANAA